jgi:hypothetical protein
MSMADTQALFGAPKHSVLYTIKGQRAEYRIRERGWDGSFGCFDFIDDVLVGFSRAAECRLSRF